MRGYLGTCREAWANEEFWFPYGVNVRYGKGKKTRLQIICEEMYSEHRPDNIYLSCLLSRYDVLKRVENLLELGADPNIADTRGYTPLHVCARNAWEGHIPIISALIKGGANVNTPLSYSRYTPLFLAAYNNHLEIAKILIENGASVNDFNDYKKSPLHAATMRGGVGVDMMKLLISHGALMNSDTLKAAIQEKGANTVNKIKYLYSIGCPKIEASIYEAVIWDNSDAVRALIKLGESPEVGDENFSPLELALMESRVKCVDELCRGGADVNIIREVRAVSPIHTALMDASFECVLTLCRYGADTSTRNSSQDTALHYLIWKVNRKETEVSIEQFKQFLKYVTDFKATNMGENTAFGFAMMYGLKELACEIKREEMRRNLTKGGRAK